MSQQAQSENYASVSSQIVEQIEIILEVVLPEVSKLIDTVMSKSQEEQAHFSSEKITPFKRNWIHYCHPEISHQLMNRVINNNRFTNSTINFFMSQNAHHAM